MKKTRSMMLILMSAAAVAMAQTPPPPSLPPPPGDGTDAGRGNPEMLRERARRMGMTGDSEGMILRLLTSDSRVAQDLGLTDTQTKELKEIASSGEQDVRDTAQKLEAAGMRQAELMKAETLDEAALMKAVEETGELRTRMAKLRVKQMIAAHKTLTPEQRTKLRDLLKQRMEQLRERWQQGGGRETRQGRPGAGMERRQRGGEGTAAPVPQPQPLPAAP